MRNKDRLKIFEMTKISLLVALLSLSSYIVIPLPFTPVVFSIHTVVVNLIGLILNRKDAALAILSYLIMGFCGLTVFSAGTAGPAKLFGPTGGFYFGFLIAVIVISILKRNNKFSSYFLITAFVGLPIQHIFAIIFMCFYNGFNIKSAVLAVSLPFIVTDIIKCFMASFIAVKLNEVLKN